MRIKRALYAVSIIGILYGLGSFLTLDVDPREWSDFARFIYTIMVAVTIAVVSIVNKETL